MSTVAENQIISVDEVDNLLVSTPSPFRGEGLLGFILRTAEMNGYDSPMQMLSFAGLTENEARSTRPPLSKLAKLYGKTARDLQAAGLDAADARHTGRRIPLLGHSIYSIFTLSKHAGICTECIKEQGYVEGFQELKYAMACPTHAIKVINSCPVCNMLLSWQRPGLAKCRCGADLSDHVPEKVTEPAMLALLHVLQAKLMANPLNVAQLQSCGFPVEAIQHMSLPTLLSVIYRFGLFNKQGNSSESEEWLALQTTADVFSDWPQRFHEYLENVHVPNINQAASGLRGQFHHFYESFFKNAKQTHEVKFIRDAFIAFGANRWNQAILHKNLKSRDESTLENQYLTLAELSSRIGVQPSTLRKLIAQGHVKVDSHIGNVTHKLLKLSPQQPFEFAAGLKLNLKQVAQRLDIPVDALRAYRALGFYRPRYLAVPFRYFHERDVDELDVKLMQGMRPMSCEKPLVNAITLGEIMRMKKSSEIKAHFIKAVADQVIRPTACKSEQPSGLVFSRHEMLNLFEKINKLVGNSVGIPELMQRSQLGSRLLFRWIASEKLDFALSPDFGMRFPKKLAQQALAELHQNRVNVIAQLRSLQDMRGWTQLELNLKQIVVTTSTKQKIWKEDIDLTMGYFTMAA